MITFSGNSQTINIYSNLLYPSNPIPVIPNAVERTASGVPIVEKYLSYEKDILELKWSLLSIAEYNTLLNFFRSVCDWSATVVTYTDLDSVEWQVIITEFKFYRKSPGYYEGSITLETVT